MPALAVVILVYNNSFYTRLCLESLQKTRETEPSYELIVVDNGSSDDTPRVLAEFAGLVSQVIRNDKNRGFARASNQGVKAAGRSVRHIVFLNNDIVVEAGWLRELARTAAADPRVGIVGARLLYPNGTIQHAGIAFGPNLSIYHAWAGQPADSTAVLKGRERQAVTGACMLVERELFESLGGFDEGYANSFEDIDLCLRARELGRRIVYCPESVAHHFESVTPGRLFRDDCNYDRFRARWLGRVAPDSDLLSPPLAGAVSEAALMLSEFESLAERVHALEIENARLVESLALKAAFDNTEVCLNAEYVPDPLPRAFSGSFILHPVKIQNTGNQSWRTNQFSLAYHWRRVNDVNYLVWNGIRSPLVARTEPGEWHIILGHLDVPDVPGDYILEWDLVEEGVTWLSGLGIVVSQQLVRVLAPPVQQVIISNLPTNVRTSERLNITVSLERCVNGSALADERTITEAQPLSIAWQTLGGKLVGQPSPLLDVRPFLSHVKPFGMVDHSGNQVTTTDVIPITRLQAPRISGIFRLMVFGSYARSRGQSEGAELMDSSYGPIRTLGGLIQVRGVTQNSLHYSSNDSHKSKNTVPISAREQYMSFTAFTEYIQQRRRVLSEKLVCSLRLGFHYASSFVFSRLNQVISYLRSQSGKAGGCL